MADVFISYSRKDKEFVQILHEALSRSNYDAWVDWQDIPGWWKEIEAGIEAAHTCIFVISPDGKLLAYAGWDEAVVLWNPNLDNLLVQGCGWLHSYLSNNPNVSDENSRLCEDV